MNQDFCLLVYPWQFVVCRHIKGRSAGAMEYWSVGLKSGNGSDLYSFTFDYPRSIHGLYFSIISTIHHSITPSLQVSLPFTNSYDLHPASEPYFVKLNVQISLIG